MCNKCTILRIIRQFKKFRQSSLINLMTTPWARLLLDLVRLVLTRVSHQTASKGEHENETNGKLTDSKWHAEMAGSVKSLVERFPFWSVLENSTLFQCSSVAEWLGKWQWTFLIHRRINSHLTPVFKIYLKFHFQFIDMFLLFTGRAELQVKTTSIGSVDKIIIYVILNSPDDNFVWKFCLIILFEN